MSFVMKRGSNDSLPQKLQRFTGSLPIRQFDFSRHSQSQLPTRIVQFPEWLETVTPSFRWDWAYLHYVRLYLDKISTGEINRLMLFLPPRHGKTEMTTIRYPVWRMEREPNLRVIVGAYNQLLANKFSRKARRIAESRLALNRERYAVEDWETVQGGGLRAIGVGAGITGQGGNLIVIDDPVKSREEAQSEAYRERVWDWYRDDLYTRLEPGGAIILIMTRWHEDDLAGRILASEDGPNWIMVSLPAEAEASDPLGRVEGEALCPERYPISELARIRTVLGTASYTALYQQRPTPAEGGMFKRQWFQLMMARPETVAGRLRYWDRAATEAGGDYTVGTLMSVTPEGIIYIEDVQRGQWSTYDRDKIMRQTAELDGVAVQAWFEQEPGSSGVDSARAMMRTLAGYSAHPDRVTGDKVIRAGPLAAQAEAGNVKLVRGPWVSPWLDELTTFPNAAHDDQVDSASGSYNILARRLARPRATSRQG